MKKSTKKGILQKMTISILSVLLLVNFMLPTYSHADFGGVLLDPVTDLVAGLGDIVIGLVQGFMNLSVGGEFINSITVDSESFEPTGKHSDFAVTGKETIEEEIYKSDLEVGFWSKVYQIPLASLSPEEIFGGKVPALDINFIKPNYDKGSAAQLQETIASWYVALRNLAVVGLLSILVYVGIRIILSSTASDKAKYKQMLTDWVIALCLLFFMQYIMSFVITMTESITTAIIGDSNGLNVAVKVLKTDGTVDKSFATNLLGVSRIKLQSSNTLEKCSYLIIYVFLIYYTIVFTWKYLKRMIMMAFLTIISPLVVLTYPIDKMNDGKAQAFDAWLKEYVFNALLQPFHLVIYYVFVLSAMDLATSNLLYTIVVMWFIPKAEEILRKFFGFDKAPSLGSTMAGFAGGLGLSKLLGGKGGGKGKSPKGEKAEGEKTPRFNRSTSVEELPDGNSEKQENNDDEETSENPYELPNYGEPEEQLSPEEMAEQDPNYMYMHPEQFSGQNQQAEQSGGGEQSAENAQSAQSAQDEENENSSNTNRLANWVNGHGGASAMVKKGIKGAARFGTRTAFTLAGGMGGAILGAAQGKGISGMFIGAYAGGRTGNSAANPVIGLGGKAWNAGERVARGIQAQSLAPVLGGTALGRELDLANGNTRYQDAASSKNVKTDENNVQYVREYLTDKNGGRAPTNKEVKEQMNSLDPYIEKGFSDIKDMIKSQKAAQKMGLDDTQAAIIAAIGKKNNITPDRLNDDKKAQADYENLVHQLQSAGVSKDNAEKRADLAMNYLKEKEGIKNKR